MWSPRAATSDLHGLPYSALCAAPAASTRAILHPVWLWQLAPNTWSDSHTLPVDPGEHTFPTGYMTP